MAVNGCLTGAGGSGHLLDAEAFVAGLAKQAQRGTKDGLLNRGIKRPAGPATTAFITIRYGTVSYMSSAGHG